ncbi:MAG: hypothetical protein H7Y00_16630 [Fimbriimonadaceae bacterium]|nr:hypothetical protein [Chitinophagales bacterium]
MKNQNINKQNKSGTKRTQNKPDIRDDMDSRENKERNYKDGNNKQGKKPNTKDRQ